MNKHDIGEFVLAPKKLLMLQKFQDGNFRVKCFHMIYMDDYSIKVSQSFAKTFLHTRTAYYKIKEQIMAR